jgi:hypothetical protein
MPLDHRGTRAQIEQVGRPVLFLRQTNQLFSMLQRLRRHPLSRQHPADLPFPRIRRQLFDLRDGASLHLPFFHQVMMVREPGNLRQVGDAEHLV